MTDPEGPAIEVYLFGSEDLSDHWDRLDAFEGGEYRRAEVLVNTPEGALAAW